MSSVFNYQTLKVRLEKSTKSLIITLNIDHEANYFGHEFLFELESLLAWCTARIEIKTILIQSQTSCFSKGHHPGRLKKLTLDKLQKFSKKLQKINQAIMFLPQTVIIDIQLGTENIATELALACDIRIANRSATINFNHSKLGLIPCSGGIAQLTQTVGHAHAKNWMLTGDDIRVQTLEATGFVYKTYTMQERDDLVQQLLQSINSQASVQRIQTKLGIVESIRPSIEAMYKFESQIAKAAFITEDWKENQVEESMKAKSFKHAVKLSLIKSDSTQE